MKDPRLFDSIKHPLGFGGVTAQWLGAHHCFAGFDGHHGGLFVQMIGQADHDHVGLRVVDGFGHVRRPLGNVPFVGELFDVRFRARVDDVHPILAAMAVQRHRIKHANQPGSQHGYFVHDVPPKNGSALPRFAIRPIYSKLGHKAECSDILGDYNRGRNRCQ